MKRPDVRGTQFLHALSLSGAMALAGCGPTTSSEPPGAPAAATPKRAAARATDRPLATHERADAESQTLDAAAEDSGAPHDAGTTQGDSFLLERSIAATYRGLILRSLLRDWICPKPPSGLVCSPTAVVTFANTTVDGFSIAPCGVPEIDAAAQGFASGKLGQQIPPPPPAAPGVLPGSLEVVLRCK